MIYTDETPLPFGRHKFISLCRVPADYLLMLYKNPNNHKDAALQTYLEQNIEKITRRSLGLDAPLPLHFPCEKHAYASEKIAKVVLARIKEDTRPHKKPVRAYECPTCGQWHLTSLPYEVWQNIQPAI